MYLRKFSQFFILVLFVLLNACQKDNDPFSTDALNFEEGLFDAENLNPANLRGDGGDRNREAPSTDLVLQWMNLYLQLDRYATGMRPNATARAFAYISLTGYEAMVPTLRGLPSNSGQLPELSLVPAERERRNWSIALNEAYSIAFDHFIINLPESERSKIEALRESIAAELADDISDEVIETSEAWGSDIAAQIIAYAQSDTDAEAQILEPQPTSYAPPAGEGYWTFSAEPERALFPYWGQARTFIISPDETSTIAPLPYSTQTDSEYFQQMMEVYDSNNSARDNDDENLWIAEFWSDDVENLMFSPPARQVSIANQLVTQYSLDLGDALKLYLKLGLSMNDAAVATWKYKYDYMVMRPSVFIQNYIDENYQTNLYRLIPWPNPTFPAYPSGHSCFASAAAGVFIDFFGNSTDFTDTSHEGREEFRGAPRQFSSFTELAEENAYSRIPLGVHMRMDCDEGLRLGYEIAEAINNYNLRPQRNQ